MQSICQFLFPEHLESWSESCCVGLHLPVFLAPVLASGVTLRLLVHFELFAQCLLHVDSQFSEQHCWWGCLFSINLTTGQESDGWHVGLFLGLLFHWLLFLCQSFVTAPLLLQLCSIIYVIRYCDRPPALLFFVQDCFGFSGSCMPLCKFLNFFSVSVKNSFGVLMGIALNQLTAFDRIPLSQY
jgi:hypothetical protein